jgi:hypothetical protein
VTPTPACGRALLVATLCAVGSCATGREVAFDAVRCADLSSVDAQRCDTLWSPACDHPLDRAIVGVLRDHGIDGPAPATTPELCRRLALDLIGRPPTPAEAAGCLSVDLDTAVDDWLAHPERPASEARFWAALLGYDVSATVYWRQIDDLDARVHDLARDALRYDDFATQVVVHPAFTGLHANDAWADAMFRVFLGRPARPDEVAGLRHLSMVFREIRPVVDGRFREWARGECLARGGDPDRCQRDAEVFRYREQAINPCICQQSFGCVSTALGGRIDIAPLDCAPSDDGQGHLRSLIGPSAGQSARCRDGTERCGDQVSRWDPDTQTDVLVPARPLQPASAALRDALDTIGGRLTARGDFWEAAADRELQRLLGWWQDAFKAPEADLPAARCVLAEVLEDTGSVSEVQRLILTSRLYATPVARDGQQLDAPPWASARLKFLSGERWLQAAAAAVGETIDVCDHRLVGRADHDVYWHHAAAVAQRDGFEMPTQSLDPDFFRPDRPVSIYDGFRLGACRAGGAGTSPNLLILQAQGSLSASLCAVGGAVVPASPIPALDADGVDRIADHLFERALGRPPASAERDAVHLEIDACVAAGACQTPDAAARWLCARVLDSNLFALY